MNNSGLTPKELFLKWSNRPSNFKKKKNEDTENGAVTNKLIEMSNEKFLKQASENVK